MIPLPVFGISGIFLVVESLNSLFSPVVFVFIPVHGPLRPCFPAFLGPFVVSRFSTLSFLVLVDDVLFLGPGGRRLVGPVASLSALYG